MTNFTARDGRDVVRGLVQDWRATRAALDEIERREHPDLTDRYGRTWTWWKGDLYRHCGSAIPGKWVATWGRPMPSVLDNPNYHLCETCVRLAGERASEGV